MDRYLTTESKGLRLVQLRVDHEWLKNPENIGTQSVIPAYRMPGEFLGCWRETGRRTKKLHYHMVYIVPDKFKKKDWAPRWQHILKPDAPDSCKAIKFYNSKNFNNGENWAYYIGYCAKCNDPMGIDFQYSNECREQYELICREKGSDEHFKSFVLKRLTETSTDHDIHIVIVDWYQQQCTQHNVLIMDQRYWQILALISPDRHKARAISALQSYQNKFLS